MKRVALYIRVSTAEQAAEGYSIDEQTVRLTKCCEAHGWILVKVYTDPGYSGAKMDRPALQQLFRDIRHGLFDTVLVYKLDRLSRSQKDTMYIIEDVFTANHIDFISMNENFDTSTPFGRAMVGILSVFAQLERDQIKERMQMGLDARAKEGYYHGGPYAPIGYDYANQELSINPYEASIVHKTYELYLDGMPVHAIARFLCDHYPGGTRYGMFTASVVNSILRGIIYTGRVQWKGEIYPGRHEALIDIETFEKVQRMIKERQIREPTRITSFNATTLLSGIIFCGNCGGRYYCKCNTPSRKQKIVQKYYTCYSRGKSSKNMIKDPTCKNPSFNIKVLDKLILDEIAKLELSRNFDPYCTAPDYSERIASCESAIASTDKKIAKLIDLYTTDGIPANVLSERIEKLNQEKSSLEAAIIDMKTIAAPELSIPETNQILDTFHAVLNSGDMEAIRNLVRSLISTIMIQPDSSVEIHWRFSPSG